jgi:hypothetical protein
LKGLLLIMCNNVGESLEFLIGANQRQLGPPPFRHIFDGKKDGLPAASGTYDSAAK